MTDESAIVRQWMPIARKIANRLARAYRVTEQEREDIFATAPVSLWRAARAGHIEADTPVALAWCVVWRRLSQDIREWRPNYYLASGADVTKGERRYISRPIQAFTEWLGDAAYGVESFAATLPDRGAGPDAGGNLADLCDRAAKAAGLSSLEHVALRARAEGERQIDTARRLGCSRQCVYQAAGRAVEKLRDREDIREMLV